jgi:hypothetical protein
MLFQELGNDGHKHPAHFRIGSTTELTFYMPQDEIKNAMTADSHRLNKPKPVETTGFVTELNTITPMIL